MLLWFQVPLSWNLNIFFITDLKSNIKWDLTHQMFQITYNLFQALLYLGNLVNANTEFLSCLQWLSSTCTGAILRNEKDKQFIWKKSVTKLENLIYHVPPSCMFHMSACFTKPVPNSPRPPRRCSHGHSAGHYHLHTWLCQVNVFKF